MDNKCRTGPLILKITAGSGWKTRLKLGENQRVLRPRGVKTLQEKDARAFAAANAGARGGSGAGAAGAWRAPRRRGLAAAKLVNRGAAGFLAFVLGKRVDVDGGGGIPDG